MRVLLDSSTLIAAMLPDHVHHSVAHAWLSQAKAGAFQFVVSGHSIAEVYSVLTRLPRTPRISPAEAWQLLCDNVTAFAEIVNLAGAEQ
jgi:predicted nucleic acid-binding protein